MAEPQPTRTRGVVEPVRLTMSARRASQQARLLKALADPTRLQIVSLLAHARAPVCICDLTAVFGLTQPTVSHHMATLKRVGLVDSSRQGIWAYYHLHPDLAPGVKAVLTAFL